MMKNSSDLAHESKEDILLVQNPVLFNRLYQQPNYLERVGPSTVLGALRSGRVRQVVGEDPHTNVCRSEIAWKRNSTNPEKQTGARVSGSISDH